MIRRLPVLQSRAEEDEAAEQRPRSHWVAMSAGLTFALWIPLAMLGMALGRRVGQALVGAASPEAVADAAARASSGARAAAAASLVIPSFLALALACGLTGSLVGRFGGRSGAREAVLGGSVAALVAWLLALSGGGLSPWPVAAGTAFVLVATAALFSALGARLGVRRRPRP